MENKPLNLQIETPCPEKWDAMQSHENGRFCHTCQQTVVDFTGRTDDEVLCFFTNYQNKDKNCCIQIETDRLNQPILPQKTQFFRQYYRPLLTVAIITTLSSFRAEAQTGKGTKTMGAAMPRHIVEKDSLPKKTAAAANKEGQGTKTKLSNSVCADSVKHTSIKQEQPIVGRLKRTLPVGNAKGKETLKPKFIPKSGPQLPRVKHIPTEENTEKKPAKTENTTKKTEKVKRIKLK